MKSNVVRLDDYRPHKRPRPIDPLALMFFAGVGMSIGLFWYGAWRAVCPFI